MKVRFTVPGEPKGKGRPRMTKTGHTYTPQDTVLYENLVKLEYLQQCGKAKFDSKTPVDMRITAYFAIPKSTSKSKRQAMLDHKIRPIKKPDSSNILKAVEDALNGIAYADDAQIVDTQMRRFYSNEPRVVVTLQEAYR